MITWKKNDNLFYGTGDGYKRDTSILRLILVFNNSRRRAAACSFDAKRGALRTAIRHALRREHGHLRLNRMHEPMFKTSLDIQVAVLVGIGGGVRRLEVAEDSLRNVHLGDAVVGWPGDQKPACVYHDRGRSKVGGKFEIVGTLQDPDLGVTTALSILALDHDMDRTNFDAQFERLRDYKTKRRLPTPDSNAIASSRPRVNTSVTMDQSAWHAIHTSLSRDPQTETDKHWLIFYRGRIATGNAVIRNGDLIRLKMQQRSLESCSAGFSQRWLRKRKG